MRRYKVIMILVSVFLVGYQSFCEPSSHTEDSSAYKAYEEALAAVQQEYEEYLLSAREAYEEALAAALVSFENALASIRDNYQSAIVGGVPIPPSIVTTDPTLEEIAERQQQSREAALAKARSSGGGRTESSATQKLGRATTVAGGTGTATFKGVEMGNALSTTFGASQGTVGRNLYVPIYLFMPLPESVDDAIFQRIGAKETFKKLYHQSGSTWTLKAQVPLAQRGDYWRVLEDAGYDPSKADYKTGKKLKPVTLEFAVGPIMKGSSAELVDVRLVSSSGSSEIDEAVIYGFKQSAFFNKTGKPVPGKFVHSF